MIRFIVQTSPDEINMFARIVNLTLIKMLEEG